MPENILILLYFSVNNELVDNWMDRLVWTRDGEENETRDNAEQMGDRLGGGVRITTD